MWEPTSINRYRYYHAMLPLPLTQFKREFPRRCHLFYRNDTTYITSLLSQTWLQKLPSSLYVFTS